MFDFIHFDEGVFENFVLIYEDDDEHHKQQ